MANNLVKNNEMARILDMTPSAFAKAVREGDFSIAGVNPQGHNLFDVDVVVAEYQTRQPVAELQNHAELMPKSLQGGRPPKTANGDSTYDTNDYLKIKIINDTIKAKDNEVKYKLRVGELIAKSLVKSQGAELGNIIKSTIDNWPSRLSPLLYAMRGKTEREIRIFLEKECNELIKDIRSACGYE
ncbi:MAG: hypothetical protein FWG20_03745 [Candidatus Cloacimonetes bacterium]|nr:hypothetical protein [Candidatus Cloacimonadota bacterium]